MSRYRSNRVEDQPLHHVEPDVHWKALRQGDRVLVRSAPGFETAGFVDAVSRDHTTVWVDLDGGRGRTLVHCSDGVEILPNS